MERKTFIKNYIKKKEINSMFKHNQALMRAKKIFFITLNNVLLQ